MERRDVILQHVTTKKRICCKLWGWHAESVAGFSEGSTVECRGRYFQRKASVENDFAFCSKGMHKILLHEIGSIYTKL